MGLLSALGLTSPKPPVVGYVRVGAGKVKLRQGDDVQAAVRKAARQDRAAKALADHIKRERGWFW